MTFQKKKKQTTSNKCDVLADWSGLDTQSPRDVCTLSFILKNYVREGSTDVGMSAGVVNQEIWDLETGFSIDNDVI